MRMGTISAACLDRCCAAMTRKYVYKKLIFLNHGKESP
jgi:hypothetical protein